MKQEKYIQMQRLRMKRNDRVYNKSGKYPKRFSNEQEKKSINSICIESHARAAEMM